MDLLAFLDLEDLYVEEVLDDDEDEDLLFCFTFLLSLGGEYFSSSFCLIFSLMTEGDGDLSFFCSLALALVPVAERPLADPGEASSSSSVANPSLRCCWRWSLT